MNDVFARGSKAFGFCDRCGFRTPLARLKEEFTRGVSSNNRVCPACWDADHPQNFQGMQVVVDAQALKDPRPDTSLEESRRLIPGPYTMDDIP